MTSCVIRVVFLVGRVVLRAGELLLGIVVAFVGAGGGAGDVQDGAGAVRGARVRLLALVVGWDALSAAVAAAASGLVLRLRGALTADVFGIAFVE